MKDRALAVLVPFLRRHKKIMGIARWVQYGFWYLRLRLRTRKGSEHLDVNRTYWVDPKRIEYALVFDRLGAYDKWSERGKIIGGSWDRNLVRFEELGIGVFRGLEDRFVRHMEWEETDFYRKVLETISAGTVLWGCRNKANLDERCRYLDALYQDMKENGYRTQQEIGRSENDPYKAEDEITVRIGRDGALLFEDGQHRLAMAKLLNIDSVPIKITARHSEWYQFRKEVLDYAIEHGGKVYHPLTHPDLQDIPSMYGDERFELIRSNLPVEKGDLLDIGAHWGYFCHRFEDMGFTCYAVESDAPTFHFLQRLSVTENKRFTVIYGSIFDYREKTDFDVVLALNIFHHFIKAEETYQALVDMLHRVNMGCMFFQPELPDSPQMRGAYRNFSCEEFVDFIIDNSNLREAKHIGETQDGRPIYVLTP